MWKYIDAQTDFRSLTHDSAPTPYTFRMVLPSADMKLVFLRLFHEDIFTQAVPSPQIWTLFWNTITQSESCLHNLHMYYLIILLSSFTFFLLAYHTNRDSLWTPGSIPLLTYHANRDSNDTWRNLITDVPCQQGLQWHLVQSHYGRTMPAGTPMTPGSIPLWTHHANRDSNDIWLNLFMDVPCQQGLQWHLAQSHYGRTMPTETPMTPGSISLRTYHANRDSNDIWRNLITDAPCQQGLQWHLVQSHYGRTMPTGTPMTPGAISLRTYHANRDSNDTWLNLITDVPCQQGLQWHLAQSHYGRTMPTGTPMTSGSIPLRTYHANRDSNDTWLNPITDVPCQQGLQWHLAQSHYGRTMPTGTPVTPGSIPLRTYHANSWTPMTPGSIPLRTHHANRDSNYTWFNPITDAPCQQGLQWHLAQSHYGRTMPTGTPMTSCSI